MENSRQCFNVPISFLDISMFYKNVLPFCSLSGKFIFDGMLVFDILLPGIFCQSKANRRQKLKMSNL